MNEFQRRVTFYLQRDVFEAFLKGMATVDADALVAINSVNEDDAIAFYLAQVMGVKVGVGWRLLHEYEMPSHVVNLPEWAIEFICKADPWVREAGNMTVLEALSFLEEDSNGD